MCSAADGIQSCKIHLMGPEFRTFSWFQKVCSFFKKKCSFTFCMWEKLFILNNWSRIWKWEISIYSMSIWQEEKALCLKSMRPSSKRKTGFMQVPRKRLFTFKWQKPSSGCTNHDEEVGCRYYRVTTYAQGGGWVEEMSQLNIWL